MGDSRFVGKSVAVFSANYLPHLGGVENYTYHLAKEMTLLGARVSVVTLACEGATAGPQIDDGGFRVVRLESRALLGGRYPIARPLRAPQHALDGEDVDYVIVNTRFYPQSLSGVVFAQARGVRPIVIDHGSAHLTLGNPVVDKGVEAVEHGMTALMKRRPADYYGVSKRSSEWLSHFGITSCGELYNSIDAVAYAQSASSRNFRDELGLPRTAPIVSFVGRIIPEKGISSFVDAARRVPGAAFLAAGDGPLKCELEKTAPSNVSFLGRLRPEDTAALLTQSNLFCLPTRSEGFATSLLEASACKTPSIITDVGGARELIADETYGAIVPSAAPEHIARAVQRALDDEVALKSMGEAVYTRVRDCFSWRQTALRALEACDHANRR